MNELKSTDGYTLNGFRFNFCKRFNITDESAEKKPAFAETYVYKMIDEATTPPTGIPYGKDIYPDDTVYKKP